MMNPLVPLLIVVGAVGVLIAIIGLPGYLITRARTTGAHVAVEASSTQPVARHRAPEDEPPLDAVERDWYTAVHRYAAVVDNAAVVHLEAIDNALAAFMVTHQIELPDVKPVGPPDCAPWAAVDLALLQLRVGLREPAWAPRSCAQDTALHNFTTELQALLDAEQACGVAA